MKQKDNNVLMPVMYYIHGGSFYAGSAYEFLPDFLLEEDLVLVVVQYRLGILGRCRGGGRERRGKRFERMRI